jgi:integrase
MAVVTGMRRGELLALCWSNIDFERQTLTVLHTVDYIPHYGYVENEPNLRHSAATILLGMGVNKKAIQELLGHSDISITLGLYSHLLPNMQQDVVNKWEDAFKGENKEDDKELQ